MKNKYSKYLFTSFLLISLFLTVLPAAAETNWDQKEIYSQDNSSVISIDISGDYILFLTSSELSIDQSSNRVHLYDTQSGSIKTAGIPSPGMTVTGNDISGDYAVWVETQTSGFGEVEAESKPNTLYLMNIQENIITALNLPENADWPKISGNTILWSETPSDSFETNFSIYNIKTKENTRILNISPEDPADIDYDNGNIGYSNSDGVHIYNIYSGKDTLIFKSEYGNESGSNVMDFDLSGDYLIYFKHLGIFEGDDKGIYTEPYLYTISSGETRLINPITGNFTNTLTKDEKKASIISPFTDGETVGWGYLKSESDSDIILLDPLTEDASVIKVADSLSKACIDGEKIIWTKSVFPSFKETLYFAEENQTAGNNSSESSPGFSVIIGILGISLSVILMKKIKE